MKYPETEPPEGDGYQKTNDIANALVSIPIYNEWDIGRVENVLCQRWTSPLPDKPDLWVKIPEIEISKDKSWNTVS